MTTSEHHDELDPDVLFAVCYELKQRSRLSLNTIEGHFRLLHAFPHAEMRLRLLKQELREFEWLIDEMVKEYSRVMDDLSSKPLIPNS
jgi:hypothetical protein